MSSRYPAAWSSGANGWMLAKPGHVIGSISAVALSFIVHEPSGIIDRSRATSLSASRRRYRSIAVSLRCSWNTGCVRNGVVTPELPRRRHALGDAVGPGTASVAEDRAQAVEVRGRCGLVAGDRDHVVVDGADVDAAVGRGRDDRPGTSRNSQLDGVEEVAMHRLTHARHFECAASAPARRLR